MSVVPAAVSLSAATPAAAAAAILCCSCHAIDCWSGCGCGGEEDCDQSDEVENEDSDYDACSHWLAWWQVEMQVANAAPCVQPETPSGCDCCDPSSARPRYWYQR